jgi:predicted lysophospholipase L1 biosynthesis ABC-type transport system permease subunit
VNEIYSPIGANASPGGPFWPMFWCIAAPFVIALTVHFFSR